MLTVIGFRKSTFTVEDGREITGVNMYVSEEIPRQFGEGHKCDRYFMTMDKLAKCGYYPVVGDNIEITYNKYGKPEAVTKI